MRATFRRSFSASARAASRLLVECRRTPSRVECCTCCPIARDARFGGRCHHGGAGSEARPSYLVQGACGMSRDGERHYEQCQGAGNRPIMKATIEPSLLPWRWRFPRSKRFIYCRRSGGVLDGISSTIWRDWRAGFEPQCSRVRPGGPADRRAFISASVWTIEVASGATPQMLARSLQRPDVDSTRWSSHKVSFHRNFPSFLDRIENAG